MQATDDILRPMRFALIFILTASSVFAQTDEPYTAEIRKHTTEARFMTELVDHLPASETVPSPLKFNGYSPARRGSSRSEDVYRYIAGPRSGVAR